MKPAEQHILTINGGSSSIKFALFAAGDLLRRILAGGIERIGLPEATFGAKRRSGRYLFARGDSAGSHGGGGHTDGLDRGAQYA